MTKKIINVKIFKCITTRVYIIRAQITLLRSNEMKKLLSLLFSILLVSSLVFSTVSCNKEESEEEVLDGNGDPDSGKAGRMTNTGRHEHGQVSIHNGGSRDFS